MTGCLLIKSRNEKNETETELPKKLPINIAGIEMPAKRAMPTGAPTRVPSCHRSFFFLLQGFLPQNVQPEGLK